MSFGKCQAEELYVRVATGEYFFGTVVHEKEWLKKHQPKEESDE